MANFQDILNKRAEEIERPKPLPVGSYIGVVSGIPAFSKVGKNETDAVDLQIKLLRAMEDVDQGELSEVGGLENKSVRARFFLTEDAVYRLKEFLVDHLQIDSPGATISALLSEAPGRQVVVQLKHRPSQDGSQIYHEIAKTTAV